MAATQVINDPKKPTCKKVMPQKTVEKIVRPFLNKNNNKWIVESCGIQFAGESVIGFQGDYYKIEIVIKQGHESKKLHYFMKSLPSDLAKAEKLKEAGYFNREFKVYSHIFSEFDKFQSKYRKKSNLKSLFGVSSFC